MWAVAQTVIQQHGAGAPVHVAERIGALALAGDEEGVVTWKAIPARIDQLEDYGGKRRRRHQ